MTWRVTDEDGKTLLRNGFPREPDRRRRTEKVCGAGQFAPLTAKQTTWLEYALSTLKPREADMLLLHFEMKKTYKESGLYYGRSYTCVYQVITKAIRKLRHPSR